MKKFTRVLTLLFLITVLFAQYVAPTVTVHAAAPLVYEGFDYAPGYFVNNTGGNGWGGGWNYFNTNPYRQGSVVGNNDPLIYTDGTKYLNTSGRDIAMVSNYCAAARLLDRSAAGALKDYITAANGFVGKVGTTIWGSYLTNFPNYASNDSRFLTLSNADTNIATGGTANTKVSIGTFGGATDKPSPSQYLLLGSTTATAYLTMRFYVGATTVSYTHLTLPTKRIV